MGNTNAVPTISQRFIPVLLQDWIWKFYIWIHCLVSKIPVSSSLASLHVYIPLSFTLALFAGDLTSNFPGMNESILPLGNSPQWSYFPISYTVFSSLSGEMFTYSCFRLPFSCALRFLPSGILNCLLSPFLLIFKYLLILYP